MHSKNLWLIFLFTVTAFTMSAQTTFDIEGHRGCRGLYPENTITAFIEAVKLGVNTLEMDVVVSKDGQLVVSHDPWMNDEICTTPEGKPVTAADKSQYKIYNLTYAEIKQFDCGLRGNAKFAEQKKMAAYKPLLSEVIETVEKYLADNHLPAVYYNIETKSTPDGDDINHPKPAVFAGLLYDLLKQKNILPRCIIQSFDPRTLKVIHQTDPTVKTAILVFNADGFKKNLTRLGFTPAIYSPNFILVNKKLIQQCHQKHIRIIPWTVNDEDKMKALKNLGVDGLITDYPDRALKVLR